MDWLAEVFWTFNGVTGFITILPLAVSGIVAAVLISRRQKTSSPRLIIALCTLAAGSVASLFYGLQGFMIVMAPVVPYSPYVNAASIFMFWLPAGIQAVYLFRSPRPRWYIAAGLAIFGVFLGWWIIGTVGGAVGAQTD